MAVLAHAAFNAALFTGTFLGLIVIPLVLFLWWRAIVHSREALVLDNQRFS